ncbi:MAG: twin-arginine translocation signal domain-containing protein [Myxococcota bacterium]
MHSRQPPILLDLSRRDVLKMSLAAGALGVLGPLLPACSPTPGASKGANPPRYLTDLQYAVLMKAVPLVLPPPGAGLPDPASLPIPENLDRFFGSFPPPIRKQISDGFALFEYGALVLGWHFKSFTRLSDEAARDYLVRWRTGHTIQKAIYRAITLALMSCYWQEEATWKPVGYAGPLYKRAEILSLGNAPLPGDRA